LMFKWKYIIRTTVYQTDINKIRISLKLGIQFFSVPVQLTKTTRC